MTDTTTTTTKVYELPAGYVTRWERTAYDLLKKTDTETDGSAWLVACNTHGTTTPAAKVDEGDKLGTKAQRVTWCDGCKTAEDARPAKSTSTPAAPGTIKVNVNLAVEVNAAKWSGEDQPTDDLIAAIKATGADDDHAAELAALVLGRLTDPEGFRAQVREFILEQVQELEKVTASGAVVTLR